MGQEYTVNSDVLLYAQYKYGTYKITLNNQDATTPGTESIYEKYNTGYYLDENANTQYTGNTVITIPSKDGFKFRG